MASIAAFQTNQRSSLISAGIRRVLIVGSQESHGIAGLQTQIQTPSYRQRHYPEKTAGKVSPFMSCF